MNKPEEVRGVPMRMILLYPPNPQAMNAFFYDNTGYYLIA
jgi:hypothetical protein